MHAQNVFVAGGATLDAQQEEMLHWRYVALLRSGSVRLEYGCQWTIVGLTTRLMQPKGRGQTSFLNKNTSQPKKKLTPQMT